MDSLRKNLERATKITNETGGGILVITEGVFGMSGKVGALDKIVEMKKDFNFRLLVDDAHGFGKGVGEYLNCTEGIDLYFSTFAKSMAAIGAFIAAPKEIIMYLKYNMRSQTYAKALPMPFVIGGMKRLELIKKHPELREKLWENVRALQKGLKDKGFDIGETQSPVTPVFLHGEYDIAAVTKLVRDLRENMGIFCSIVVYPVVPKGQIMLRIIPTSSHTLADIEYTCDCFAEVQKRLKSGYYAQ
jgi:glycine C-acetyltransferase